MGSKRRFYGKDKRKLKYSKTGRPLCRYCDKEVFPPKRTFCSKACVHEWRLRTSSSYVRRCLLLRDRGICGICSIDTVKLKKTGKQILKEYGREAYWKFAKSFNMPPERKSWFDADHVVPVAEGGGECGLEGYRTLCPPCHKRVTKQLQNRLAKAKKIRQEKKTIRLPASSLIPEQEDQDYIRHNRKSNPPSSTPGIL
jgi:5-methylcytosine-specific restriction protein A